MTDVVVRPLRAADADAAAEAHVRGWQVGYRGILAQPLLDGLSVAQSSARFRARATDPANARTIVAEVDGAVVGWSSFGPCRDDDRHDGGELMAIYVHPDVWGRGVGHALLVEALDRLADSGFSDVTLWVLERNRRGREFYERHGFTADGTSKAYVRADVTAPEVRYRRELVQQRAEPVASPAAD